MLDYFMNPTSTLCHVFSFMCSNVPEKKKTFDLTWQHLPSEVDLGKCWTTFKWNASKRGCSAPSS